MYGPSILGAVISGTWRHKELMLTLLLKFVLFCFFFNNSAEEVLFISTQQRNK